jgi:DNA polymerase-3 subunit epsilon
MANLDLAGPIAVIDVETTGLFPLRHDRIIEIAAVLVGPDGRIEREFVSLVNPGRDVGPTRIHQVTAEDVAQAPSFAEIAGLFVDVVRGSVAIAAHNARFDRLFLESEFARIGAPLQELPSLCTMQLAGGGKLKSCCENFNIAGPAEAHTALSDARATAQLLVALLKQQMSSAFRSFNSPIAWPPLGGRARAVTRSESRKKQTEKPGYLQRLLSLIPKATPSVESDGALMAYGALLDRVLEDRRIDEAEQAALIEMAQRWGLSGDRIAQAHADYVRQLAIAAVADGIVSTAEHTDLMLAARLLGQDQTMLDRALNDAMSRIGSLATPPAAKKASPAALQGKKVCFTGELQCSVEGALITREKAESLASEAGLQVMPSVTKKLDLLVVADPHTQSGKARKAQSYGIRILHEPVFWRELGVAVD